MSLMGDRFPSFRPSFHIGDEDDFVFDNEIPVSGRFIVTPAMERRKSSHYFNNTNDSSNSTLSNTSDTSEELEENERVVVVVEAELHEGHETAQVSTER